MFCSQSNMLCWFVNPVLLYTSSPITPDWILSTGFWVDEDTSWQDDQLWID